MMSESKPLSIELEDESRFNRRYAVRLADGAQVEAVLYRGDSLCVSSQVGCAVACPFCASGANGLQRPLSLEELKAQVLEVEAVNKGIKRITLSGVGEPLHNKSSFDFVAWCRQRETPASLTTSGGPVERLREALNIHHNGLTISVHSGTEAVRAKLVPNGPSLESLFGLLYDEIPKISRSRRRKVALAYLMMNGENDTQEEIDAFAAHAKALDVSVHLFSYNPVASSSQQPVPVEQYEAAHRHLLSLGLHVQKSSQARTESNGGCGTLVALKRKRTTSIN